MNATRVIRSARCDVTMAIHHIQLIYEYVLTIIEAERLICSAKWRRGSRYAGTASPECSRLILSSIRLTACWVRAAICVTSDTDSEGESRCTPAVSKTDPSELKTGTARLRTSLSGLWSRTGGSR